MIFPIIAGTLGSLAHIIQAGEIYTTNESEGLSLVSLILVFGIILSWLIYGININNRGIMITHCVSLLVLSYIIYKKVDHENII
jgi:uncharacterized protein with PQ loop repeat